MKRLCCLLIILLPVMLCARKQPEKKPEGVRRLEVRLSDNPVQGGNLEITYLIEALDMNVVNPPHADGGRLVDVRASELKMKGKYYIREFTFVYEIHCSGIMKVLPMEVQIFDKLISTKELMVSVAPHPDYGQEWTVARNYLHQKYGYAGAGLKYRYGTDTYKAFYDHQAKIFAVVVDKDYQPYISWPVLAYGNGNQMWDGKDEANTVSAILAGYDAQLRYMKMHYAGSPIEPMSFSGKSAQGVKPLLGDIEYAQDGPYNQAFLRMHYNGGDSLCVAGCGAVALAQILSMYRFPQQPSGKARYSLKSVWEGEADLRDYPVNWDDMQQRDTANLIFAAAASLGSQMSPEHTASSLSNFMPALICHWGYSPRARYVKDESDSTFMAMVYEELDNGRPVALSGSSHTYVCDGYDKDFLHYNFGWEGDCNGWYRAIVIPSMDRTQLPFTAMVTGISPMSPPEGIHKEVTLSQAGTLATILSEEEKHSLTSLKVNGNVNGEDIALLRKMAGGKAPGYQDRWTGSLMTLDLSDAAIVSGGVYYEEAFDGYSDQSFQARKDVIGQFMFIDCQILRNISLPHSVRIVEDYAFFGCRSLQHIDLNGAEGNASATAFRECVRLETPALQL